MARPDDNHPSVFILSFRPEFKKTGKIFLYSRLPLPGS
jgi:hypothetical protein